MHFINLVSNYNATRSVIEAPIAWNETGTNFYTTGHVLNLPAIAITIIITLILISGIHSSAIINLILVVFKIIVLLIFILVCARYVKNENYDPFIPENEGW